MRTAPRAAAMASASAIDVSTAGASEIDLGAQARGLIIQLSNWRRPILISKVLNFVVLVVAASPTNAQGLSIQEIAGPLMGRKRPGDPNSTFYIDSVFLNG